MGSIIEKIGVISSLVSIRARKKAPRRPKTEGPANARLRIHRLIIMTFELSKNPRKVAINGWHQFNFVK
jgi:hypothetical protein